VGENLDGGGMSTASGALRSHFGLMVDAYNLDHANHPYGHRLNVLNGNFSEIGIGAAVNDTAGKVVQDFGDNLQRFVTGVVYRDANNNHFYDPGEGLAGVTVKASFGNYFAVTSSSGGYAFPFEPATVTGPQVALTVPAGEGWNDTIQQQDAAFQAAFRATNAPQTITATLTFSGGSLASPVEKTVTFVQPVRVTYQLVGTDGWFFSPSIFVGQSIKVDAVPGSTQPGGAARISVGTSAAGLVLSWTGGQSPFRVQSKAALTDAAWKDVATGVMASTLTVPVSGAKSFFRVLSSP